MIVVLTKEVRALLDQHHSPGIGARIRLLQSYAGERDADDDDIIDPPGQSLDAYRAARDAMNDALLHLSSTLTATPARRRKYISAPKEGCSPTCSPASKRNPGGGLRDSGGGWGEIGRAEETPC